MALDNFTRLRLRDELRSISERFRVPVVFITHDPVEASTMADTLVVFSEGRVGQVGTSADVFNHPIDLAVAEMVGVRNNFPGIIEDGEEAANSTLTNTGMSPLLQITIPFQKGSRSTGVSVSGPSR